MRVVVLIFDFPGAEFVDFPARHQNYTSALALRAFGHRDRRVFGLGFRGLGGRNRSR